jgi:hypothetical protein
MKPNLMLYLIVLLFFEVGCSVQSKDSLVRMDVAQDYPEKELILNDIADISYLCLKSDNEEYIFKGRPIAVTQHTVVVQDEFAGSALFFSKDGNPKSRFNRRGNGPEEYLGINQIVYDEEKDEVFIVHMSRIQVYSSQGEYKRGFSLPQGTVISPIVSFDENSLFLYDASVQLWTADKEDYPFESPFVRISKTDGAVLDYVKMPAAQVELGAYREVEGRKMMVRARTSRLIKGKGGVFLCNPESDTVFFYGRDQILTPVMYKTPSITTQEPMVYLNNCVDAGSYQFMEVYTIRFEPGALPYPAAYLMRDKKTGEVFRQKLLLPDYKGKVFSIGPRAVLQGDESGAFFELDLMELKQAYADNLLSGRLKELTATLNEIEDNNVYVWLHFKQNE